MKNNTTNKILFYTIFLICFVFLTNCASKPKQYFFNCSEQTPEIINSYIPGVLFRMGYEASRNDSIPNSFIATKRIISRNLSKGIEKEYIEMRIFFNYETKQSFLTQQFVRELNGKKKVSVLTEEQLQKFEPDVNSFIEKMFFYCNPKFKGR